MSTKFSSVFLRIHNIRKGSLMFQYWDSILGLELIRHFWLGYIERKVSRSTLTLSRILSFGFSP